VIFSGGRVKKIHWKTALAIGSVLGVLMAASILNEIPLTLQQMPTTFSISAMQASMILAALLGGIGTALYVLMLAASGEPIYREMSPHAWR